MRRQEKKDQHATGPKSSQGHQGPAIPQQSNQEFPPIEALDDGKFDDMFFKEPIKQHPVAKPAKKNQQHRNMPSTGTPKRDNVLNPSMQAQPVAFQQGISGILGLPPFAKFENGGFEEMFLQRMN